MKKDDKSKVGASGVETEIPGTEHYGAGHKTLVDIVPPVGTQSDSEKTQVEPSADESVDLSGIPGQANDTDVTERVRVPEAAAAPGAESGASEERTETEEVGPVRKQLSSSAKWLAGGLIAFLLFGLVVGYFLIKARPEQVAKANHPVPTVMPTPAPAIKVENVVPLPIGVDSTDCKPEQVIVDREHHALRFPASCSKLIYDQAAK